MDRVKFAGTLAMDGASIGGALFMRGGRFKEARLHGVRVTGQVSMIGTEFAGRLAMDGAVINSGLFLRGGKFQAADLLGVRVTGQVSMSVAEFAGKLAMDRAVINGGLFLGGGKFQEARLPGVRVTGQVDMEGAEFAGDLAMDRAVIGGSLFLGGGKFQEARLLGVQAGGQVAMNGAEFAGNLTAEGLTVDGHLLLGQAVLKESVNLSHARIKGGLNLAGAKIKDLDLKRASVVTLAVSHGVPSENIVLDGLSYEQYECVENDQRHLPASTLPTQHFIEWLSKQKEYSPQPYEFCAKMLREAGQPRKANKIIYAGRRRERKEAWQSFRKARSNRWTLFWDAFGKSLVWLLLGYGLELRIMIWICSLFIVAGAGVAISWNNACFEGWSFWARLAYSIDKLIPFTDLLSGEYSLQMLSGFSWWYFFYIHQLIGAALMFAVIAGLADLIKRRL